MGVIGNTPDSGSGVSRFESWSGNHILIRVLQRFFVTKVREPDFKMSPKCHKLPKQILRFQPPKQPFRRLFLCRFSVAGIASRLSCRYPVVTYLSVVALSRWPYNTLSSSRLTPGPVQPVAVNMTKVMKSKFTSILRFQSKLFHCFIEATHPSLVALTCSGINKNIPCLSLAYRRPDYFGSMLT